MRYLLEMLSATVSPIGVGFALGGPWRKLFGRARWPAVVCGLLFIGVWSWLSSFMRRYADTDGFGWQLAEYWTQTARWYVYAAALLGGLGIAAGTERQSHLAVRRVVYAFAVLFVVLVTAWRTFPLYVVLSPGESTRDELGFMRQTVEFTCGPVALANLLERYHGHPPFSERRIAKLATCPGVRHATLMFGIDESMIYFADPACGPRRMTHENFLKVWYGTTLIFEPGS